MCVNSSTHSHTVIVSLGGKTSVNVSCIEMTWDIIIMIFFRNRIWMMKDFSAVIVAILIFFCFFDRKWFKRQHIHHFREYTLINWFICLYTLHLSVIGWGKRYDVRQHNLAFLCCLLLKSIPTFMCVCEKRRPRQNALNLSWPFEKGWETWEEMSIEAIRTGGALNYFRKRDASMTASKIEVGRGPIDSTIFSTAPLHLSFYSQTRLWSLLMSEANKAPLMGSSGEKKMLLKVLRNRKTKNGLCHFLWICCCTLLSHEF